MSTLTDYFISTLAACDESYQNPEAGRVAAAVFAAPDTPESIGLRAYLYHEGAGVARDLDKAFELAEKAAFEGGDPLGYFLLGYMCDNAETPDQAEGGPRQKYDHYDAERFYEKCASIDSRWAAQARLWLGEYYLDSAKGGDPEIGVEYLASIAEEVSDAACALSDYYWEIVMPFHIADGEREAELLRWTSVAAADCPEEYAYRMGWIYADGVGVEKDTPQAMKWFEDAAAAGDSRGATACAELLSEHLANDEISDDERERIEAEIARWKAIAESLRDEELLDDPDPCEEED